MASDWRRPDWLADAVRAWTPGALLPPSLTEALRPAVDLFGFAPAMMGTDLIGAAASRLIGRPMTLRVGDSEVNLVLRVLQLERPPLGLMIGQLGDVEVEADDVVVADHRISHLRLDVRNVHLQPAVAGATVVATPIRVRAVVDESVVRDAVADRTSRLAVELRGDGVARATLTGRRGWGHVDVVPRVDGRTLVLEPAALAVRTKYLLALARRLPPLRVELPRSIPAAHVTSVTVDEGRVVIEGVYEEWRWELGHRQLDELVRRINRFDSGVLQVPDA